MEIRKVKFTVMAAVTIEVPEESKMSTIIIPIHVEAETPEVAARLGRTKFAKSFNADFKGKRMKASDVAAMIVFYGWHDNTFKGEP